MRLLILFTFFTFIYVVAAKSHVKSLTESMGQEVIEIGAIKELPPGLEEEPSAEVDDEGKTTASSIQPATKRDIKKITTVAETKTIRNMQKTVRYQEDEEARVEKELAEIYRDTADYKSENSEEVTATDKGATSAVSAISAISINSTVSANSTSTISDYDKPIARQGASFKFQPNLNNKADIERFRTSVDEIRCDKRATQKLHITEEITGNSGVSLFATDFYILSALIVCIKSIY